MAGIEELKKRGFVDTDRMGVSGWSYGGYMTTWMLGHYDVWKAGVTGASVTSQLDQYNLSDAAGGRTRQQLAVDEPGRDGAHAASSRRSPTPTRSRRPR
jgi:dipeptidyl aminopeptidase/acylaminoacyl peptidase